MSPVAKWAVGMMVWGILVTLFVYGMTGSVGWATVGLLAAGIVGNAVIHPRWR